MTDKFTREYVANRIEARMGKLKLIEENSKRVIESWKEDQLAKLDETFQQNEETLNAVLTSAKEAQRAYGKASTWKEKAEALALFKNAEFPRVAGIRTYQSRPGWGENRPEVIAKHDLDEARSERVKLEHALIYLNDMPATEFSLSGLRSLGLLQVLKFDITIDDSK